MGPNIIQCRNTRGNCTSHKKAESIPPKNVCLFLFCRSTNRGCYVPTYITPSLVLAAASSMPALVFSAAATTPSLAMENPFISTSIVGDKTAGLPCSKWTWLAGWCLQLMCRRDDVRCQCACLLLAPPPFGAPTEGLEQCTAGPQHAD